MAVLEAGRDGSTAGQVIDLRDAVTTTLEGLVATWREDAEGLAAALRGEADRDAALAEHEALISTL